MKSIRTITYLSLIASLFYFETTNAQNTITIGTGTSSSSTRGPFQRSDTNSTTVYSRWVQIFTSSELSSAGLTNGAAITQLNWELASSDTIIGTGNASLKIYIKNSSATSATSNTWVNLISGSTLAMDTNYNTTNNFPGANGWMPFEFSSSFTYTGGAIEVAVDWDGSQLSTPSFSGDGSVKWRWSSTSPDSLVVKKTSSSSASSTISDYRTERANIQIVYNPAACDLPSALGANALSTSAYINWTASANATSYNWKVVASGAGSAAAAIDSGNTTSTIDTTSGLTAFTSYDLYVESECGTSPTSGFVGPFSFMTQPTTVTTTTIGVGTSSSSTRGPFQRADTNSSTVYSRWVQLYTAAELTAAGIVNGNEITALNWDLASSNIIIGSGNANLKVYIKNSTDTSASADSWTNLINGSSLFVNNDYNTTNNFPGANGWMPFNLNAPFTYTGGSIEIAVDWDCSQVSTPAFSGDGAIKWKWESTGTDTLVVKATSSSSTSTNLSDLKDERANIQFVYEGNPVGIKELENSSNFSIYPNPTRDGITSLKINLVESSQLDVSVYSIKGELLDHVVKENVTKLNYAFDLSSYGKGMYFLRVSVNNETTTKKIIFID